MEHSLINEEAITMTREQKVQKLLKSIQTEEKAFHALSRYNVYDDLERWQAINGTLLQLYQQQYESLPEEVLSQQTSLLEMYLDFALTRDEVILEAAMDSVILNRFLTSWFPQYPNNSWTWMTDQTNHRFVHHRQTVHNCFASSAGSRALPFRFELSLSPMCHPQNL